MAVDFLNIPGDIRQKYLPFVINSSGKTQLFTYKEKYSKNGAAVIHPFSKHLQSLIANDSSFQYTHGPNNKKVEYKDFLDLIPGIQIREFVPDAKLTQTFKWFSYLKRGFDASAELLDSKAASSFADAQKIINDAWKNLSDNMRGLTSGSAPLLGKVVAGLTNYYKDRGFSVGPDAGLAVLIVPFILYYRLTTTHTNNIYEIPYSMKNNIIESDGTYGWGDDGGTDFSHLDVLADKAGSFIKAIAPGLGSTVKVNAMPSFSPTGSAAATSFDVTFDLINDSDSAAVANFLFCHTLFGNNRWMQYGFVQTGASLYDVKFPGANRYFMCKGRFVCKGKGSFRTPSDAVVQRILKYSSKGNTIADAWSRPGADGAPSLADVIGRQEALNAIANASKENSSQQSQNSSSDGLTGGRLKKVSRDVRNAASIVDAQVAKNKENAIQAKTDSASTKTADKPKVTIKVSDNEHDVTDLVEQYGVLQKKIPEINARITETKSQIDGLKQNAFTLEDLGKKLPELQKRHNELDKKIKDQTTSQEEKARLSEELRKVDKQIDDGCQRYVAASNNDDMNADYVKDLLSNQSNQFASQTEETVNYIRNKEIPSQEADLKSQEDQRRSYLDMTSSEMSSELTENLDNVSRDFAKKAISDASESINVSSSIWKDLIKIPDVYSITLTFTSLIPDNFNNYLFGWRASNLEPIENYFKGTVNETGAMEKLVQNLIAAAGG